jgi:hypothetical protein
MSGPPAWPSGPPTGPPPGWGQAAPAPPRPTGMPPAGPPLQGLSPGGAPGGGAPTPWGAWGSWGVPGPPAAPPGPSPARGTRWPWVVGALVAAVAIAVPAAVLVARGDADDTAADADPDAVLGAALEFLDGVDSVRFEGEGSLRVDADIEDEYPPLAWDVEASSEFPHRGLVRLRDEWSVTELLVVGDRHYTRSAEDEVDDLPWSDLDELGGADEFLPPTFSSPHALRALLLTAHDPALVPGHDGSRDTVVLAVDLAPDDDSEFAPARSYDPPTAELVVDPDDGRVTAFTIRAGSPITQVGRAASELEAEVVEWDAAVDLEEPGPDELDPLPFFDDEGVRAYDDAVLYQPAELPEGFEQSWAGVASADETVEGCEQVEVTYDAFDVGDWIDLWQFPESCAGVRPPDADDIVIGEWEGWVADDGGGVIQVEFVVDGTNVQIMTTLSPDELALAFEHLDPLDLEHPPPATLEAGKPD